VTGSEEFAEPLLPGEGDSDYERYLRTGELLALQKGPGEWAHRDELLFQTVHQASELWLKLAATEVVEATRLIPAGDSGGAIRLLRRANDCLKIVFGALDMLEHLSPWEYQ
jgi:tryptophan 2,3-dioxygenase